MTTEQENIVLLALDAFRKRCAIDENNACLDENAKDIAVNILGVKFLCQVMPNLTAAAMKKLCQDKNRGNFLLITKYVNRDTLDKLTADGINVLDACGNFFVKHSTKSRIVFQLSNSGESNLFAKEKLQPLFQEAGLKLIYFFLQNRENVALPYRAIQEATGISLGSIKNLLDTLTASQYLMLKDGKRVLKNTDNLTDVWATEYIRTLKPKLLLGRMSFRSAECRESWKSIALPGGVCWGGECGANIVDGYLTPGSFELYSDVAIARLMQSGKVKIDADGEIAVYQRFWPEKEKTDNNIAPMLLLYADLLGQGSSRCIEAAEKLKEHEFDNK